MSNPKDNFRQSVERIVWANSNLEPETRAEVLREFADELENSDRYEQIDEQVRYHLKELGYELPETGNE